MTSIIASMGREPGYPTCDHEYKSNTTVISYTDRFKLLVSDENALGETILKALPTDYLIGSYLGSVARLKKRTLKRDPKNRLLYSLDLMYSSEGFDDQQQQDQEQSKPPDQRKAEWAWDFETISKVLMKDVDDGRAMTNSADEPFEVVSEIAIPILTIERWEAFFDPSAIINYINHRNKNTFWTAPADSVVCTGIRDRKDSQQVYSGLSYRKVTYNFKFMVPFIPDVLEGAKEIVADIGTRYVTSQGPPRKYTEYRSTGGMPTKCNLNTDGTLLTASNTLLFKKFNKFPKADFDDLHINNTQI